MHILQIKIKIYILKRYVRADVVLQNENTFLKEHIGLGRLTSDEPFFI